MEAISGRKTIEEIAADHAIHPIQVSQWKRQLLDGVWSITEGLAALSHNIKGLLALLA
jgi:hypothetical protein